MKPLAKLFLCVLLIGGGAARPQAPARPPQSGAVPTRAVQTPTRQPGAATTLGAGQLPAQKPGPTPPGAAVPTIKPVVALPPPSLLYGVEVAWGNLFANGLNRQDEARATQLLNLMHILGVTNTRVHISWAEIEAVRGRYNWRRADALIHLLRTQGLIVTCLIDGTPSWARDTDPALARLLNRAGADPGRALPPLPTYTADLGRFALALGARYKESVQRWELWNEPDGAGLPQVVHAGGSVELGAGGDVGAYLRMLRAFTPNVRRGNPNCLVAIGGLSVPNLAFLQTLYAAGAQSLFDAVSLHPATPGGLLRLDWADACHNLTLTHGPAGKKLWITSWGWATYTGMPDGLVEGEQAHLIREGLAAMKLRPYIDMACVQTLNDWERTPGNPLSLESAGICTRELQPKAAFTAFAIAARDIRLPQAPTHAVGPAVAVPAELKPGELNATNLKSNDFKSNTARVEVDASDITGRLPVFWRGLEVAGDDQKLLSTARWRDIRAGANSSGAALLRLEPFRPGTISTDPTGTPVITWDGPDALLRAAMRSGDGTVMDLRVPPSLSARGWQDIVTAAARRYSRSAYGIVRWELSATSDVAAQRYAPLAQAVRATAPGTPVGINLLDSDPVAGTRRLFAALPARIPIDSYGFQTTGNANQTAQTVRALRALLVRFPERANMALLPSLNFGADDASSTSPAGVIASAARLLEYANADQHNSLLGAMTPLTAIMTDDRSNAAGNALTLLNQVAGARLRVTESSSGVRCLATRNAQGVQVLVWREAEAEPRSEELAVVQLRNLPHSAQGGWQISRRVAGQSLLASGLAASDARGGATLPFALKELPEAIAATGASGDLELPILLAPSTVTLITLQPHRAPIVDLSVEVTRPSVFGGALQNVIVQLHNPTARPLRYDVRLSGSHPGLVPDAVAHLALEPLPAGGVRRLRYPLVSPLTGEDTDCWVNVQATNAGGDDSRAAILWRTLSPLEVGMETSRADITSPGQRAVARVRLVNLGNVPLPLTLTGPNTPVKVTLPVGNKPIIQEIDVTPKELGAGLHSVGIAVASQGVNLRTLVANVGIPAPCRYTAMPPTVDGDLSDWQDTEGFGMGREDMWHGISWGGPADLSAVAYTRWDEHNFYFACAVTQARFAPPHSLADLEPLDSIQFAVSTAQRRQTTGAGYGAGDHEFGLALVGGKEPMVFRMAGGTLGPVKAQIAIRRSGNRTTYEAAIPWSELLPDPPQAGTRIGFAMLVNHGDGQARGYMEWGGGIGGEKRPELFPPLRLEK